MVGEIEIVRNDWQILEALDWCSPSTYDNSFIHAVFVNIVKMLAGLSLQRTMDHPGNVI